MSPEASWALVVCLVMLAALAGIGLVHWLEHHDEDANDPLTALSELMKDRRTGRF